MIQRCWRLTTALYERYGHASNGPDQSETSRIVFLARLISIWYCIANASGVVGTTKQVLET